MLTNKMNPERPFKYVHAQVSTRALKQSKVVDPNPFPLMNIYHSKTLIHICLLSFLTLQSLSPPFSSIHAPCQAYINPKICFSSAAQQHRGLFFFFSWFYSPFHWKVFTCVTLSSFFGAKKIFSTDGSLKKSPFCSLLKSLNTDKVRP